MVNSLHQIHAKPVIIKFVELAKEMQITVFKIVILVVLLVIL